MSEQNKALARRFPDEVIARRNLQACRGTGTSERAGVPLVDGLLAATARIHGLTLATRHVRDVARTGVRLVNPFEP